MNNLYIDIYVYMIEYQNEGQKRYFRIEAVSAEAAQEQFVDYFEINKLPIPVIISIRKK